MAEETAPAPAATIEEEAEKKPAVKRKRTGPNVRDLIVKSVSASKERSGVSIAALKKALAAGGYDVEKNNSRIKISVKSLVANDILVQTSGTGVSGSFKLNRKRNDTKPAVKVAFKVKKPKAKKPATAKKLKTAAAKKSKTTSAKKPKTVAAKKAAAKKSPKKVKKPATSKKTTKSPKKAKKPTTHKKTAKSPKKAKAAKPKTVKPKAAKPKNAAAKKK